MNRSISLILYLICTLCTYALTIPKGTFYFDNSKTKYTNVKFVYGSDNSNETFVASMTHDEVTDGKSHSPKK